MLWHFVVYAHETFTEIETQRETMKLETYKLIADVVENCIVLWRQLFWLQRIETINDVLNENIVIYLESLLITDNCVSVY